MNHKMYGKHVNRGYVCRSLHMVQCKQRKLNANILTGGEGFVFMISAS